MRAGRFDSVTNNSSAGKHRHLDDLTGLEPSKGGKKRWHASTQQLCVLRIVGGVVEFGVRFPGAYCEHWDKLKFTQSSSHPSYRTTHARVKNHNVLDGNSRTRETHTARIPPFPFTPACISYDSPSPIVLSLSSSDFQMPPPVFLSSRAPVINDQHFRVDVACTSHHRPHSNSNPARRP